MFSFFSIPPLFFAFAAAGILGLGVWAAFNRKAQFIPRTPAGAYERQALDAMRRRDVPAAMRFLTQAVEAGTQNPNVYMSRGTFLLNAGDFDGALADFEKAVSLAPGNAEFRAERAKAYAAAGKAGK